MKQDELVRMSTQIAQFFEPYPQADAIAGVQDHLLKFWDPSMRTAIFALHKGGKSSLHPLVTQALDNILAGSAV